MNREEREDWNDYGKQRIEELEAAIEEDEKNKKRNKTRWY